MHMILIRDYPTSTDLGTNGFVHMRVKSYISSGLNVGVFVLRDDVKKTYSYTFDNVEVCVGDKNCFRELYSSQKLYVYVHFIDSCIIDCLEANKDLIKKVAVFVHGYEALFWYQRIFAGTFTNIRALYNFLVYVKRNTTELRVIRRFLACTTLKCEFIAVSEWMKNQAEKAWKCNGKLHWHIIPNYINSDLFSYNKKTVEDSRRLLSIRSFGSGKYANDLTAKIIRKLEIDNKLNGLVFTWVGKGILYNKITKRFTNNKSIKLENRFMTQNEIKKYHLSHGIFICPTRQDAQGVSMCEAMSSGLVPITLYNTAIPEYLPNIPELVCNNVDDMERLLINLTEDYQLFSSVSKACSDFIHEKCSYENTIEREISLLKE